MRNDDSALCLSAHELWGRISRKLLEIDARFQMATNRKWPMANQMVTLPMTSHDLNSEYIISIRVGYRVVYNAPPTEDQTWGIEWSLAR